VAEITKYGKYLTKRKTDEKAKKREEKKKGG